MSSRASTAISSRRAKQELVRLLFGAKYARKGPEAHSKLDPARYSFTDLRKAYLERLQTIHPDKLKHAVSLDSDAFSRQSSSIDKKEKQQQQPLHGQFVELQEAWDNYEEVAKMIARVGNPDDANFTLFGVGCSFSDNAEERAMRDEIMDQACRGWFSAGGIAESCSTASIDDLPPKEVIPLCDDDLFVQSSDEATFEDETKKKVPKPSLIPSSYRAKRR